ncbi:Outer membrane lipoprotein-sorting protein [Anaerohalosphaera lusitana]|uniref:Outer membrane lipoprotein-sorting protein n=1 Tax=Anaerohalosphaera lusitana TaxID=1936003 RepID=A0A1U9NLV1_9BACT|nr:hypothetical protein [Anaerohalosphaera lusitana]AQT68560.1 Outer membrane lipoprotein-sorting protein [Anaerohalosphaera lusitana]
MNRHITTLAVLFTCIFAAFSPAETKEKGGKNEQSAIKNEQKQDKTSQKIPTTVDGIIEKLRDRTSKLDTYKANINYLFIQDPELLDSRRLQKGKLYYKKTKDGSGLKIEFSTVKQDDAPEEKRKEELFFDGVWLTRIDYRNETVNSYQQVPEDKPVDAFDFVSQNFPMVGFSHAKDLRKQFEIELIDSDTKPTDSDDKKMEDTIHLRMKVKEGSVYEEDYKLIDFWVDKKLFLPKRIRSVSVEDDIYDITLLDAKVNKKIENSIFSVEHPSSFSKNREPLKQN